MQYPTQSATIFGAPFAAPVEHTVLPVGIRFQDSVRLLGYIPIASTEFDGTETTFDLGGTNGSVPVISVTKPRYYKDPSNSRYLDETLEYMAVLYDRSTEYIRPWLGISSFIPGFKSGYYTRYINTSIEHAQILTEGNLVGSLRVGMASADTTPPPAPVAPEGQNATLRWNAALNLASLPSGSEMFDFQWVPVFQSSLPVIEGSAPTQVIPLSIEITSQPTNREFVATIVQSALSYVGQGLPMNHAVRIIKLASTVPPGNYIFGFRISANYDGTVLTKDVTLTLEIVGDEAAP